MLELLSNAWKTKLKSKSNSQFENHPNFDVRKGQATLIWQGSQFVYHSLALINRELCLRLIDAGHELSIIPYEKHSFGTEMDYRFNRLATRFNSKLKKQADVHIRHQWPPNFEPPSEGHWVIFQHWEYGSLPKKWILPMKEQVDEIWVLSSFARECFSKSGIPKNKIFIVPGGVDTDKFRPDLDPLPLKTKKRFKFLFVGGTIFRKGIDILLDAYCSTFTARDDVCLVVKDMGGGSFYRGQTARQLISDIQKRNDAPEIEYLDKMMNEKEMARLYTACDCLAHPYRGEGFGLPIAEAMASGLPVIVTQYGAALDFCSDDNAYLIPASVVQLPEKRIGDQETVDLPWLAEPDLDALKKHLRHVFEHSDEATRKGQTGRSHIEANFTWDNAASKVMGRIECLLTKPIIRLEKPSIRQEKQDADFVSIIIPVNEDLSHLNQSLGSIVKHTFLPHEIIFVLEASIEKSVRNKLKRKLCKINRYRIIVHKESKGFAEGCNEGVRNSKGDYILILSPSAIVTKNWLSNMLDCLKSMSHMGVVGPMSNIRKSVQQAVGSNSISNKKIDNFAEELKLKAHYRRIPCYSINDFCMLFSRDLFDNIGGFDDKFGLEGGADTDFCLRAAMQGKSNMIAGDVYVHLKPRATQIRTKKYFKRKWNNPDLNSLFGKKLLTLRAMQDGAEAYQRDNLDKAINLFIEGIQHSPGDSRPYFNLAEILLQGHNFREAMDVMKQLPQTANMILTNEILGYCAFGTGQHQDAIQYAKNAISLNRESAPALNLLGLLALKQNNREKSVSFFKEAMAADPGYGEPHANLGKLWKKNDPEKALDYFESAFILSPNVPDILSAYHSAITQLEQYKRAEPVFESAVSAYPLNKILRYRFVDVLYRLGKLEEALKQIQESMVRFGLEEGMMAAALKIREMAGPKEIPKAKKAKKTTLSICMITKDEEAFLAKCLHGLTPIADEIIVADTGSTDQTKDIATIFGARVYDFEWSEDFSEARNFSLSKANGDWIFVVDADEVISPLDHEAFLALIQKGGGRPRAYSFTTRNYVESPNVAGWTCNDGRYTEEEKGTGWHPSPKVRLFPNEKTIHFQNPVHEIVEPSLLKNSIPIKECDVPVHHYGQLDWEDYIRKGGQYYQLGKKKLEEKGEDLGALVELATQAGGAFGKHEEAVGLWKRVLKIDPQNLKALVNMGSAHMKLGDYEAARSVSEKAVEIAPNTKDAIMNFATCEVLIGERTKSISLLEELLKKEPEFPPALALLASAYAMEGKTGEGAAPINRFREMGFACDYYLHDLAKKLVMTDSPDQARRLLQFAVKTGNGSDEINSLLEDLKDG